MDASIEERTIINGVYCRDLFSAQIAAEADGTADSMEFTLMFSEDLEHEWICPDTDQVEVTPENIFSVDVVPCGQAAGDIYANGTECSNKEVETISMSTRFVSTNFDPSVYQKDGKV